MYSKISSFICFSFSCCQKKLSNERDLKNAKNTIEKCRVLDFYKLRNWGITHRNDSLFILDCNKNQKHIGLLIKISEKDYMIKNKYNGLDSSFVKFSD
jgi:hypothetical protein